MVTIQTGQAAGMVYLGGDYYGDPGSQRTYDTRTKTYSTNYNWLVAELKKESRYVGDTGQLTSQQQAEKQAAERRLGAEDFAREQTVRRGRFTARPIEPGATVGVEAAKQAEKEAYQARVSFGQSERATTPSEALSIQRMLRSPTAQFSSQATAQKGYELAYRHDRRFAPEHVQATLSPKYAPTPREQYPGQFSKSQSYFGHPTDTAGVKPSFATPPRPGSIAELAAFERRREGFYTYRTVKRLEGVSSRLQEGFERTIGYDERSSIPVKAVAGFGSVFTGLPAFAGQAAGAGEAIIRYPSASLRGLPTGFKILSSQVSEQARTKPIEFAGSIAGMATVGRYAPKITVPKPSSAGFKAFARSEAATLAPKRQHSVIIQEQKFVNPLIGGVKTSYKPLTEVRKTKLDIETGRLVRFEVRSVAAQRSGYKAQQEYGRKLKTSIVSPEQTYKPVSSQIISQKSKAVLIPYSVQIQKKISKQNQVTSQINRQVSRQVPRTTSIIVQRQKQRQSYIQVPISVQIQRQIQTQVPIQVQKQVQRQDKIVIQKPVRPQRIIEIQPPTIKRMKLPEKPRYSKTVSSMFKKSSSILKGRKKYTTKLGGKTIEQLQAELKKRRKRII